MVAHHEVTGLLRLQNQAAVATEVVLHQEAVAAVTEVAVAAVEVVTAVVLPVVVPEVQVALVVQVLQVVAPEVQVAAEDKKNTSNTQKILTIKLLP